MAITSAPMNSSATPHRIKVIGRPWKRAATSNCMLNENSAATIRAKPVYWAVSVPERDSISWRRKPRVCCRPANPVKPPNEHRR